ncbi:MAG: nucleotide pyrophosphohydrolase [Clostridia bacterium]|nr:nucleotide pyrophosphohydrolase [Clostridia bacterium]
MGKIGFDEMQRLQLELQDKYKNLWPPCSPEEGRSKLLWLMIEAGEAADVIKKEGDDAILHDPDARARFTEGLCDVMMYLNDVLICYGITPEETENIYLAKHGTNMHRWETE